MNEIAKDVTRDGAKYEIEFSRVLPLNRFNDTVKSHTIKASSEECRRLASRFALLSLDNLVVNLQLSLGDEPQSYILRGTLDADVVQACIVTLQDVSSHVHVPIDTILVPRQHKIFQGTQIMNEAQDYEPLDGEEIELGEIATQYLSLGLDSYPRHPSVVQENQST